MKNFVSNWHSCLRLRLDRGYWVHWGCWIHSIKLIYCWPGGSWRPVCSLESWVAWYVTVAHVVECLTWESLGLRNSRIHLRYVRLMDREIWSLWITSGCWVHHRSWRLLIDIIFYEGLLLMIHNLVLIHSVLSKIPSLMEVSTLKAWISLLHGGVHDWALEIRLGSNILYTWHVIDHIWGMTRAVGKARLHLDITWILLLRLSTKVVWHFFYIKRVISTDFRVLDDRRSDFTRFVFCFFKLHLRIFDGKFLWLFYFRFWFCLSQILFSLIFWSLHTFPHFSHFSIDQIDWFASLFGQAISLMDVV